MTDNIEKKGVSQLQLRIILRTVQEFEISVGRAAECIEMLEAGRFSVADLPEASGAFGFDESPMEKYTELRAERDALAAKLAELEVQAPVGVVTFPMSRKAPDVDWANNRTISKGMPLYARPIPAEPVNARLLEALRTILLNVGDINVVIHVARAAIAAAEAQGLPEAKRLTDEEIETAVRMHGTGGWQTLASMMTFARTIEAAVLGVQAPKSGD